MGNTLQQWRARIGNWARRNVLLESSCSRESFSSPWFQMLIVMVLLIIGGIEVNPGPNKVAKSRYKKKAEVPKMSGEMFEIKMSTLLFLRGLNSQHEFCIAANMEAAGGFDDLVFTLEHCIAFLQLKHKQKAKIYMSQLLTVKGAFSLLKYYRSYLDIKQQWKDNQDFQHCGRFEDALFIVFTNAKWVDNIGSNANSSEMLELVNTQGKLNLFSQFRNPEMYELFRCVSNCKEMLSKAIRGEESLETPQLLQAVQTLLNNMAETLPQKDDLVKLLADLDSIGNLLYYPDFLSQLCFCTEQAGESTLDTLIRSELRTLCGNDSNFEKLMVGVQKWWRKSNTYLTKEANFFQDIIGTVMDNIIKEIPALKVRFVESECDYISQSCIAGSSKICIKTDCITLTCLKVLQSLQTKLLVDVSTLKTHLQDVLLVWRFGVYDVLVVEGELTDIGILHSLQTMPDFKIVVVISDSLGQIGLCQQYKFVILNDTFCISQLDSQSQCEIFEHKVMFQGFPVKLNSLADVSFLQSAVTAEIVARLHDKLQIGQKLESLDSCYLHRTFLRTEHVSKEIFRDKHHSFAVTGLTEEGLAEIVPDGEKIKKVNPGNFIYDKNCRYFIIEAESEFSKLCEVNENIHWFHVSEGGFRWKKSKGNMTPVIKHLEQKRIKYSYAEDVTELSHQVVLIIDKPGMGKTTEMCYITHMIKQKNPSTWVIRINLNQYTSLLSQNHVHAMEFLETVEMMNTEFHRSLLKYYLNTCGNVIILLDGFDEISPIYSDRVFYLLKEFLENKVRNIFVTSRQIMKDELQQKLSTLAFSFNPFTSEDQEEYLTRYWNQSCRKQSCNLSKFISSLLRLVETSLNDPMKEFAEIPLQCRMIAEIFQDDALHYIQTGEVQIPQNLDVLLVYEKFVNKKWDVYCNKLYGFQCKVMLKELIEERKEQYWQSYMNCAIISYFEDSYVRNLCNSENILVKNEEFIERFNSGYDKTGIVIDIVNNKAVFVHRTFTEYFVAMWFLENLNIVNEFYLNNNFEIVRKFLDRMLAQRLEVHTAVLNKDIFTLRKLLLEQNHGVNQKDEGGRTAIHLAVMNYFNTEDNINDSIIEILLENGADLNCKEGIFYWKPIRLAEKIRAWSAVEKLLEKKSDNSDLLLIRGNIKKQLCIRNPLQMPRKQGSAQFVISMLKCGITIEYRMTDVLERVMYLALSRGYVNLVAFILNYGVSVGHFVTADALLYKTSMLHVAGRHKQLRLVQLLIDKGADVELSDGEYSGTVLMQAAACGHVEIVELLIKHGACINKRDNYGYTALSLAAKEGKLKIVQLLTKMGADIEISDDYDRTPLMHASERGYVQVVEFLINHGASVNAADRCGYTALSLAAHEGKHDIVELLIQKEVNVELSDEYNRTLLMQVSARGHEKVVELLIDHGASVNATSEYGSTALSLAAIAGKYKIVELLLQRGADVKISDRYNRTPLMEASDSGQLHIVELLLSHGACINSIDKGGQTALSLAVRERNSEIADLLIKNGASVEISELQ